MPRDSAHNNVRQRRPPQNNSHTQTSVTTRNFMQQQQKTKGKNTKPTNNHHNTTTTTTTTTTYSLLSRQLINFLHQLVSFGILTLLFWLVFHRRSIKEQQDLIYLSHQSTSDKRTIIFFLTQLYKKSNND